MLAISVLAINVLAINMLAISMLAISMLAIAPGFVTVAAPATASVRAPAWQTGMRAFGRRRRRRNGAGPLEPIKP